MLCSKCEDVFHSSKMSFIRRRHLSFIEDVFHSSKTSSFEIYLYGDAVEMNGDVFVEMVGASAGPSGYLPVE